MLRTAFLVIAFAATIVGCSDGSDRSPPPPPPQGPEIVEIELWPPIAELDVGTTQRFSVIAIDSNGDPSNVSKEAVYSLENDSGILDIQDNPNIPDAVIAFAKEPGEDTLIATFGDFTASSEIIVNESMLLSIEVLPETVGMPVGADAPLFATGFYDDGNEQDLTDESTWSSSDTSIATVSEAGLVIAEAPGTATITAEFDGQSDTATVTVSDPAEIVSISVAPRDVTLVVNSAQQFEATASYADGTTQTVTDEVIWSSSDAGVMTPVPPTDGLFTASAEGRAAITAEFDSDLTDTVQVRVTGSAVGDTQIVPENAEVQVGEELRYSAFAFSDGLIYSIGESPANEFSVEDTSIAVFSKDPARKGILTGLSPGTTMVRSTFTYQSEEYVAETILTVTP